MKVYSVDGSDGDLELSVGEGVEKPEPSATLEKFRISQNVIHLIRKFSI